MSNNTSIVLISVRYWRTITRYSSYIALFIKTDKFTGMILIATTDFKVAELGVETTNIKLKLSITIWVWMSPLNHPIT